MRVKFIQKVSPQNEVNILSARLEADGKVVIEKKRVKEKAREQYVYKLVEK